MKISKLKNNFIWRSLYPVISITIPLLLYAAVLIIGVPKEIGLDARYGFTTALIALALLVYPAYRLSSWTGTLVSLSLTLILFALPLSGFWNSGISEGFVIGGLLPSSDSSGYYWDARRLLEGGAFSVSSRRPLFPAVLAPLLALTQQNLQVTLGILVAITAISCFLAAREVQRSHGLAAGLLVMTTFFLYYRQYMGFISTEHLGLSLGAIGFAILWRGAGQRQINNCLLGLFLLTVALIARAGTFFILPAIILWGAWSFRGSTRCSWHFLLGGTSAVLLGFILNSILLKIVGSPGGTAFSNFSCTFYGLIVGSNWTQVMIDHPELEPLQEPELSRRIYAITFEVLRAHPMGLVRGSLKAWKQFLFNDFIFSFINNLKLNFILQLLSLLALFSCYCQRREYHASLVLMTTLGILASIPFAPPWDAGIRIYAATVPFWVLLPALGLELIATKMKWKQLVQVQNQENSAQDLLIFSIIFAVFVFVGPITTKIFSRLPEFNNISCQPGADVVYVRTSLGSSINLVEDNSIRTTHIPDIRISDFKKGLENFYEKNMARVLVAGLSPSITIFNTFNLKDWSPFWLIADSVKMPKERGIVGICGKLNPQDRKVNLSSINYGVFYADSVQIVSATGNP